MKHISYFARSVYTDKLLMGLLVLIVLAVIAIIVLSSIGQIPTASEDTIEWSYFSFKNNPRCSPEASYLSISYNFIITMGAKLYDLCR